MTLVYLGGAWLLGLLAAGAVVTAILAAMVAADPQQVAQSIRDMLRQ